MNCFRTARSVALTALVLAAGAAQAVNLVQNPGFEVPDIGMPSSGYLYTSSHPTLGDDGLPDGAFNATLSPGSERPQAVQIERHGDVLSQSFATAIGQQYLVSFDLSTWWENDNTKVSTLLVSAGPATTSFTATGTAYTQKTLTFAAVSTSTTLSFKNDGPTNTSYPQIDNVSVTAVPEPGTYAMMLAGLTAVGWVVRRRRAR